MAIHLKKMRYDFACPGLPARQATPHKAERFPISNRPVRHSLGDGGIGVDWKKIFFILFMASGIAPQVGAMESNEKKIKLENSQDLLNQQLISAVKIGNLYYTSILLKRGAHTDARDADGMTVLFHAARALEFDGASNDKLPISIGICNLVVNHQTEINQGIIAALLCFKRMKLEGQECPTLLYKHFNQLLKPYLEKYVSLNALRRVRDQHGWEAYNYLPIQCLMESKNLSSQGLDYWHRKFHAMLFESKKAQFAACTVLALISFGGWTIMYSYWS